MSNSKKEAHLLTASIDEYLLNIADGLLDVQRELNQSQILSQDGRSSISYQLPKLEFELKLSITMDAPTSRKQNRFALKASPFYSSRQTTKSAPTEAASTLKGVFVAVPSDRGRPPLVIRSFIRQQTDRQYEINVLVQSAVGEFLEDVEVQFNIDKDLSKTLSKLDNLPGDIQSDTYLWYGLRTTDENGVASNTLQISPNEIKDSTIAVIIDAMGKTETIIFKA